MAITLKIDSTIAIVGLLTVLALPASAMAAPVPSILDQRIGYYERKLQKHPTLFVVHALLAAEYVEKTRVTGDPLWLRKAQASLERSLKIQPSFDGHKGMASLQNFRHRFAEALIWAQRTYPQRDNTDITALMVDAHLGLGEVDQAEQLLPPLDSVPADFYTAAAMAAVLKVQARYDQARLAYLKAEEFALEQKVVPVAVWARTNAAGMLIDSGRAEQALADLELASARNKDDPELRLHWAEYHQARGDHRQALTILEALVKDAPRPSFHHRAYRVARELGDRAAAKRHFAAAERGYRRVLDAGEIYTLGSLAQLYCDAGVRLSEARRLAQRNLTYKRDKEATDTMACLASKPPSEKPTESAGDA